MTAPLTLDALRDAVADGRIDTVLAAQVDMQGRLMGKRFHAAWFLEHGLEETHSCNYLLATDMEMETVDGYEATSWSAGYGDYVMVPDFDTLRVTPWLEGTALVLCDVLDHHHEPVPHSPRAILKRQIARLAERDLVPMMATELEFFLFDETYRDARARNYQDMTLASPYNEDYHLFQTTKEEDVMRAIRNGIHGAGIPVECSKGEASAGQEEINIMYGEALEAADRHTIVKQACKEIAFQRGRSITFMAKWHSHSAGSSSHVHQSLWHADGSGSAFYDPDAEYGMSSLMRQYVAGLLKHAEETTFFLAPNVNSYKRFVAGTFAPTRAVWSPDNRTAGYRLCGADSKGVRMECRVGGSDLNPHLALAGQIAAGLAGIDAGLELEAPHKGDAYDDDLREVPKTLRAATEALDGSSMLREAFGDSVIDHYVHAARWEQESLDRAVTDWERLRGFERT